MARPFPTYQSCEDSHSAVDYGAANSNEEENRNLLPAANESTSLVTPTRRKRRKPSSISVVVLSGLCLASLGAFFLTAFDDESGWVGLLDNSIGTPWFHSASSLFQTVQQHSTRELPRSMHNHDKDDNEPPEGCESTVMILRHCEKGHVREHCDYNGYERSVYLATLFGNDEHERWPAPSAIFVERPDGRHNHKKLNFREVETVGPLAAKAGVVMDYTYTTSSVDKLAKQILKSVQSGDMCGKLTVVSWKHSSIGHLARRLGCGTFEGCPVDYHGEEFDQVWEINFVYRTFAHSTKHSLKLPTKPEWRVYGSVQNENFDPLAFSKVMGDYPQEGTPHGMRWEPAVFSVPEREKTSDKSGWTQDKVAVKESASAAKIIDHYHA